MKQHGKGSYSPRALLVGIALLEAWVSRWPLEHWGSVLWTSRHCCLHWAAGLPVGAGSSPSWLSESNWEDLEIEGTANMLTVKILRPWKCWPESAVPRREKVFLALTLNASWVSLCGVISQVSRSLLWIGERGACLIGCLFWMVIMMILRFLPEPVVAACSLWRLPGNKKHRRSE